MQCPVCLVTATVLDADDGLPTCPSCGPLPETIAARCAAVRAEWGEQTWKERAGLRIFGAKHSREAWQETVAARRDRAVRRVADEVLVAVGAAGDVPQPVPSVRPQPVPVRLPVRAEMPVRSDGLLRRVRDLRANCPRVGTTEFRAAGS